MNLLLLLFFPFVTLLVDQNDAPALAYAAHHGYADVIRFLFDRKIGGGVNQTDKVTLPLVPATPSSGSSILLLH